MKDIVKRSIAKLNLDEYKEMSIFLFVILIANSLGSYISLVPIIVGVLQIGILIYLFIKKDIMQYALALLMFTITALERVGAVTGDLYSIMLLPYIGGYHYYILLVLPFVWIIKDYKFLVKKIIETKSRAITLFTMGLWLMFFLGIFSSIIAFVTNDNLLVSNGYFYFFLRRNFLSYLVIISIVTLLYYLIMKENIFLHQLKKLLISLAIAISMAMLFCSLFHCVYQYGTTDILMLTLSSFCIPSLCILALFKEFKPNKTVFISISIIVTFFSIMYPSVLAGKWWLLIIATLMVLFIYGMICLFRRNKKLFTTFFALSLFILVFLSKLDLSTFIKDPLLQGKLIQVTRLFDITNPDWFENIPHSPRFRIEEFVNIFGELLEKPIYLLQGKGIAASITPTFMPETWYDLSAFTETELAANAFFNVHESINLLALRAGLFGIVFFFYFVVKSIINLYKSPWILVGLIWFVFYLFVFPTLWYGLVAFFVGLVEIDERKKANENK